MSFKASILQNSVDALKHRLEFCNGEQFTIGMLEPQLFIVNAPISIIEVNYRTLHRMCSKLPRRFLYVHFKGFKKLANTRLSRF
ncbi:hypothetical protein HMPREF9554_00328 [Treponema phagedenis F0421]|nr:hypothetical protein HMPREF9554_00328 [Treponema phagedenis F0421]